jgi:2-polyprenyl-3-methyl-5-hydroxy-6-metoxy-1,4-benzoquinol methylase
MSKPLLIDNKHMHFNSIDILPIRRRQPEMMEEPGLDSGEHMQALRGLGRVNGVSRVSSIFWPPIACLARERGGAPVRMLDLASGGGDIPIAIACRAARAGLNLKIDGCDLRPQAVQYAQERANLRAADVSFFRLDALADPLPAGYDVVTCSLFLHHLDEENAIGLLRRMAAAAGRLVLVNDLVRSRRGYLLARVGCRLLTGSKVVHFDGPASVAAAFSPAEALALAEEAGLHGATLTKHWPQRFLLNWSRP